MKKKLARLLKLDRPGRDIRVRPHDRFLVSYPRSGNTWLRFLVANLVCNREVSFRTIEDIIPDIYQNRRRDLERRDSPRILKSHELYDSRYPRVVYLVRDPRGVCVSSFHYHRKNYWIPPDLDLHTFVDGFLTGALRGRYGSWAENVGSWLEAEENSETFMVVRYEDLLADTQGNLVKIADFLDIEADPASLTEAVNRSRANAMRQMETEQAREWTTTRKSDQAIPFIRQARDGSWRTELLPVDEKRLYIAFRKWMDHFGYTTSSGPI